MIDMIVLPLYSLINYSIEYGIMGDMMNNGIEQIKSVPRQTLNQMVYENLKLAILSGQIASGTKLNEVDVAKQMGTSATPVREAFRMLASEGIVRIEPWKGTIVQGYNTDEIQEVFQCRLVLEALALELLFERLKGMDDPQEEIARIEKEVNRTRSIEGTTDFVRSTSDIHDFWLKGCSNSRLKSLIDSLNDVLLYDRNLSAMDVKRRSEILAEHDAILDGIRQLDEEKAQQALARHIKNGRAYGINIRQSKTARETRESGGH